jgi:benzoate-CoA ligase
MLEHSRAQAALVSGALLPVLNAAMVKSDHELRKVIVSHPAAPLHPSEQTFEAFVAAMRRCRARPPPGRRPRLLALLQRAPPAGPRARCTRTPTPTGRPSCTASGVLDLREDDVCFSAAKLFFAYGLGNALSFPLSVGATTLLMAERATPEATFRRWRGEVGGIKPTVFYGAPTGYAGMLAHPGLPGRDGLALRLASSAGEALPAEIGERFERAFGIVIVDGIGSTEMLHIFLSNRPERVRYGTTGWPVPGYRSSCAPKAAAKPADGEPGDLYIQGPSAALMYWGNRERTRETFQGSWTKSGDKYIRNADGSYTYAGRSDDMLKVSGIYVSPFEVEATLVQHPAVLEAGDRRADADGDQDQGLRRAQARRAGRRGGAEGQDRLAAYKARHRIPVVLQDRHRQDPALRRPTRPN